eukprot:jgi/Chrzof1/7254/Cz02g16190.t1
MLALVPRTNVAGKALIVRWMLAFCRACKWFIREKEPFAEELQPLLNKQELDMLVYLKDTAHVIGCSQSWHAALARPAREMCS